MQIQKSTVETACNDILYGINNADLAIFCGAGISRNSGLPTASDFEQYVLDKLPIINNDKDTLLSSDLPFEAFMETMQKGGLNNFNILLDIYAGGKPSTTHRFLAKLMKAGRIKTIATTNFDTLIEQALREEGWQAGNHYKLFYKEEDFATINWDDDTNYRLIKIHGCVQHRRSMVVTLKRVASHHFSAYRKCVLDHIFSNGPYKKVLILGYSSSDLFDISPQIEAIEANRKRVILVNHSSEEHLEPLEQQDKNNPFRQFIGSHRLFIDTDRLIVRLWCESLYSSNYRLDKRSTSWRENVDYWVSHQTEIRLYSFIGNLLVNISEFGRAMYYVDKALTMSRKTKDEGRALFNLACLYKSLGDYAQAISYCQESLQHKGDTQGEMFTMNALGSSYYSTGDYTKAIHYYNQALEIAKGIGDTEQQAVTLNNLGAIHNTLSAFTKSIVFCQQALQIAQILGDKEVEGVALNNLSGAYCAQGIYTQAIDYSKQSLKIAQDIGNKWQEALALGNMGNIFHAQGDNIQAINFTLKALPIARLIGDKDREAGILNNLGAAYGDLKQYSKAIEYYELCLQIVREIGDKLTEGVVLNNLGTNYYIIENYSKASAHHLQSLTVLSEILPKTHPLIEMTRKYYSYAKEKMIT